VDGGEQRAAQRGGLRRQLLGAPRVVRRRGVVTGPVVVSEPADLLRDVGSRHAWPACPLVVPVARRSVRRRRLAVSHFCSIFPKCQMDMATAQVTTKIPTMTNPALLMLKVPMKVQNPPARPYSWPIRPRISMVPMNNATNTDSPVMVRL